MHTLRTRCHPAIAALPNRYFYNNRLVDGVTHHQRAPLLPGLAPLSFCDTSNSSAQMEGNGSRSSINRAEAQLAVRLVVTMLQGQAGSSACEEQEGEDAGGCTGGVVAAEQLGVICLFRAQATLIKQQLLAGE
jgi:superfamily I DNA and/or RNA helicase